MFFVFRSNEQGVGRYKSRQQEKLLSVDCKVFTKKGTECKREFSLVDGFEAKYRGELQFHEFTAIVACVCDQSQGSKTDSILRRVKLKKSLFQILLKNEIQFVFETEERRNLLFTSTKYIELLNTFVCFRRTRAKLCINVIRAAFIT